jgi:hypothetical protein
LQESQFAALLDEKNMIYAFILGSKLILYDGANSSVISETPLPYVPRSFVFHLMENKVYLWLGLPRGGETMED